LAIAGAIVFFDNFFIFFHKVLFANDYWQLDAATEKLIVIFPPELFRDLAIRLGGTLAIITGVVLASSFFLKNSCHYDK
jgi:uncharacterized membrane protein